MSIEKQGKHFYYNFRLNAKRYHGACKGCSTMRQAETYEKRLKADLKKAAVQEDAIKFHEQEIKKIIGRDDILLVDAIDRAIAEPTGRPKTTAQIKFKKSAWYDFCAFCQAKNIKTMRAVSHSIAKEYFAYVKENGKFAKTISYSRDGQKIEYTMPNRLLAPSTINKIIQTCEWVFSTLLHESGISLNPFLNIPVLANQYESRDIFTDEEIQLILNSDDDFCSPLCQIALYTGLREGDICCLRWNNIDFENNFIKLVMRKTRRSVEIPIIDRPYLEKLYSEKTNSEYVFPVQHDVYVNKKSGVPYRVTKFLKSLGIEKTRESETRTRKISNKDFHSLRHTFAVKCAENDIPLHVVQQVLGHSNPRITEIYTAHHNRKVAKRAMNRFRLFDDTNHAPVIYRLLFALEHFNDMLYSDKINFVNMVKNDIAEVNIEKFLSSVRQFMTMPRDEVELLKAQEKLHRSREQQEYMEWYNNIIFDNTETEEQKNISELSMLAEAEEEY